MLVCDRQLKNVSLAALMLLLQTMRRLRVAILRAVSALRHMKRLFRCVVTWDSVIERCNWQMNC
jgi:hypothetical protein